MAAELKIVETEEQDITVEEIVDTTEHDESIPEGEAVDQVTEQEAQAVLAEVVERIKTALIEMSETDESEADEPVILAMPEATDEDVTVEEKMAA